MKCFKCSAFFPWETGNLALGGEAVQSSVLLSFNAQKSIDGNRDTVIRSCSLSQRGSPSWWRVDWKKVYKISKVTITSSRHYLGTRGLEGSLIRQQQSAVSWTGSFSLYAFVFFMRFFLWVYNF